MFVQVLHRSVFLDQRDGGLLADPFHPRHVVRGIPHQRQHVDHLLRCHAEAFLHPCDVDDFRRLPRLCRFVDLHPFGHKLEEILVRGDAEHLVSRILAPARNGADNIVRLVAGNFQAGDMIVADQLLHADKLRNHLLREVRTVRLVGLELIVAERFGRAVPRHGNQVRLLLFQQAFKVGDKRKRGPGRLSFSGAKSGVQQRIISAKKDGHAVDQIESFHGEIQTSKFRIKKGRSGDPPDGWSGEVNERRATAARSDYPTVCRLRIPQPLRGGGSAFIIPLSMLPKRRAVEFFRRKMPVSGQFCILPVEF